MKGVPMRRESPVAIPTPLILTPLISHFAFLALAQQPKYENEDQYGRDDTAAELISRCTRQATSQKIIHCLPPGS
jgi:hypothetical protein